MAIECISVLHVITFMHKGTFQYLYSNNKLIF